jgi:predicted transcriptional regulator
VLGVLKLSEVDKTILNRLWEMSDPVTLQEISEKTGLNHQSANMRLQNLRSEGLVTASGDGFIITEKGKEAIGFPKIDEKEAQEILRKTLPENAFYFYAEVDQPSGLSSDCLMDFCEKIKSADVKSIEFHTSRGDFESWIRFLGDLELEKRIGLIREANLAGEDLRQRLYTALKMRSDELHQKRARFVS